MSSTLLLAIDQGTTSSRAALFDAAGQRLLSCTAPLESHYPDDGWVEQDAEAIWQSQLRALAELEQAISPEQRRAVAACGIANQRETTVLWQRGSGAALVPAIVWQDGRTAPICADWKRAGLETRIRLGTGLMVDPYFSASKVVWLLRELPAAAAAAAAGSLCFGTVDSWLLQRLTAGRRHATEFSNASRTLLMDLERLQWDPELAALLGVPMDALPELLSSRAAFGTIAAGLPFAGVPITAMLGDQQAATLGQSCLAPGEGKCTYGTGAFLVINTGGEIRRSDAGLLSTVGWSDAEGRPTYCLEGSLFNAGTVIQWLRDGLGLIERSDQVNALAAACTSSGGVMLVPAFTGWGTPHWDPGARGLLIGLTRDSGPPRSPVPLWKGSPRRWPPWWSWRSRPSDTRWGNWPPMAVPPPPTCCCKPRRMPSACPCAAALIWRAPAGEWLCWPVCRPACCRRWTPGGLAPATRRHSGLRLCSMPSGVSNGAAAGVRL